MTTPRRAPCRRNDFRHWTRVDTRWGDTDALGHINNANYFSYLEAARLDYMAERGHVRVLQTVEHGPVLASVQLDFRREIHFPARLQIGTRVVELRVRSYVMEHGIFVGQDKSPSADGTSVIAWVDYTLKKAIPLPGALRSRIQQFERIEGS